MKNLAILTFFSMLLHGCLFSEINGQQTVIDEITQSFSNIANVEIKGSFCNVQIDGENQTNIDLHGVLKSNQNRNDIHIKYENSGSTLKIWIDRPNNISGSISGSLNLKVPLKTNIHVDNSSGNVSVNNISKSNVELDASSGNVTAENIENDIILKTSSGDIKAVAIDGSVKSQSSSGDQNLMHISGDVYTEVSSGDINITNVKGALTSKSTSGSQHIVRAANGSYCEASSGKLVIENSKGSIHAQTSSGSIKLSYVIGSLALQSSSGSQSGTEITLTDNSSFKSSSGSIHMDLTNDPEDLSFNLRASSGSLHAMGEKGGDKLRINKGQIIIEGKSSSGSQTFE